jgi:exodeoxyribonuclease-3
MRDMTKRTRIFNYLQKNMKGIIFVQETHTIPGDQSVWEAQWGGKVFMSSGTNMSRGVAILITKEVRCDKLEIESDEKGRFLKIKGQFDEQDLTLVNLYAPTADKVNEQLQFLDYILPKLEENNENLIVGGDLNTYLGVLDKYGTDVKLNKFAIRLQNIMEELGLIDIWRITHENISRYTWRKRGGITPQQSRLDYFLIAENLIYQVANCEIKYAVYSDHCPVWLQLESTNNPKRGRGFWKFNVSLLKDKDYVDKINSLIELETEKNRGIKDKGLKWDFIKMAIRSETISYASYKAKQAREMEKRLKEELDVLQKQIAENPSNDIEQHYYTNLKELELLNNEKTRGTQIRARALHIELNEKNSRYFLKKEISNAKIKNISVLNLENGKTVSDQKEILEKQKEFYEKLYTKPPQTNPWAAEEATDYFTTIDKTASLTQDDRASLDLPLAYVLILFWNQRKHPTTFI